MRFRTIILAIVLAALGVSTTLAAGRQGGHAMRPGDRAACGPASANCEGEGR